jgi:hypothetical protein
MAGVIARLDVLCTGYAADRVASQAAGHGAGAHRARPRRPVHAAGTLLIASRRVTGRPAKEGAAR